jgi:hypothetical protein
LVAISQRIQAAIRPTDLAVRWAHQMWWCNWQLDCWGLLASHCN